MDFGGKCPMCASIANSRDGVKSCGKIWTVFYTIYLVPVCHSAKVMSFFGRALMPLSLAICYFVVFSWCGFVYSSHSSSDLCARLSIFVLRAFVMRQCLRSFLPVCIYDCLYKQRHRVSGIADTGSVCRLEVLEYPQWSHWGLLLQSSNRLRHLSVSWATFSLLGSLIGILRFIFV